MWMLALLIIEIIKAKTGEEKKGGKELNECTSEEPDRMSSSKTIPVSDPSVLITIDSVSAELQRLKYMKHCIQTTQHLRVYPHLRP